MWCTDRIYCFRCENIFPWMLDPSVLLWTQTVLNISQFIFGYTFILLRPLPNNENPSDVPKATNSTWIEQISCHSTDWKLKKNLPTYRIRKTDSPIRICWQVCHWPALRRSFPHNCQRMQLLPFAIARAAVPIVTTQNVYTEMWPPF